MDAAWVMVALVAMFIGGFTLGFHQGRYFERWDRRPKP